MTSPVNQYLQNGGDPKDPRFQQYLADAQKAQDELKARQKQERQQRQS